MQLTTTRQAFAFLLFPTIVISAFAQSKTETKKITLQKSQLVITPENGAYQVFESPKGDAICFSDEKMNSVYIKKINSTAKPTLAFAGNGCGYFPTWTNNGNSILMKNKKGKEFGFTTETVEYNVLSKRSIAKPDVLFAAIPSYAAGTSTENTLVYINSKLQLIKKDASGRETVLESDQDCYQPILSPDKKSVAVHIGSDVWIYDLANKKHPINCGQLLANSWSPDSKYLLGHIDESTNGHDISNSELYLIDTKSNSKIKLTSTKDLYEINPSWSLDGKRIYFIDSNSGNIFVSNITIIR
ncbi:MAG: PD40 domain-containing protein [Bacteroidetes bacterium]|nr:PD40 domain-containing protein [Bacteroidota bacterium]